MFCPLALRVLMRLWTDDDRAIFHLAIPALAGLATDPLVSLVDTAFVGQLGRVPLAALGVNASLFSMAFVIFNFLAYGTTPRVGRHVGTGDRDAAGRVVVRAVVLALVTGCAALAVLQAAAVPLLRLMGATGELLEPALAYLRIRAFAGPAVLLITAGHGAFRGYQDTRTPMYVTIGLNLVNLVLDPILIFGLGWGLTGAAVATVTAQWMGALAFMVLLFRTYRADFHITWFWPTPRALLPLLRVGRDLIMRTAALVGTMTLATAVAARVGVTAVAAHQVAAQLWLFMALVVDALAVAAQALVAKHLGAEVPERARTVSNRLLGWGVLLGCGLGIGFGLLRPVLPGFFTDDAATIQAILTVFPVVALLQPLNGFVFVGDGIYMGAERFPYLAKAMLLAAGGAAAILLLVQPMEWGLSGVWAGITVLMVLRTLTLAVPYLRGRMLQG